MADIESALRRLALQDDQAVRSLLGVELGSAEGQGLDQKSHALVRLAAVVAIGSPRTCYQAVVAEALASGLSDDELLGTLVAAAPIIGVARTVAAAPKLASALGIDLDAALEGFD